MRKACTKCLKIKELKEFHNSKDGKFHKRSVCKECISKYHQDNKYRISSHRKILYKENLEQHKSRNHENYMKQRNSFLEMYGRKCNCCGESLTEFLTIEHIKGQTKSSKESSHKAYRKAIKNYRPDLYEILCMNCNHSKGKYGYCPHTK